MLAPRMLYVDGELRLTATFRDQDNVLIDPDTVTFETFSPCGERVSYVYTTDVEVTRLSSGSYAADIVPDESGRWRFRWLTTEPTSAIEGDFLVQESPFADSCGDYT